MTVVEKIEAPEKSIEAFDRVSDEEKFSEATGKLLEFSSQHATTNNAMASAKNAVNLFLIIMPNPVII
jgi:hypothetical protein